MKVLNLRCDNGHGFEGWFGSDDEFLDQNGRAAIECPLCADRVISRLPSAPRLNLSGAREEGTSTPADGMPLQKAWLMAARQLMAQTEDVGERFPEEARRIHYDEAPARNIRGVATADETRDLLEEGILVLPAPIPPDEEIH